MLHKINKLTKKQKMKSLNPNNFGKKLLADECQKVRIGDFLKQYQSQLKELIIKTQAEILGTEISLAVSNTFNNGVRFWFKCPFCSKRVGILYKHPLNNKVGCRLCLNVDYRKRRYKGMLEAKYIKGDFK